MNKYLFFNQKDNDFINEEIILKSYIKSDEIKHIVNYFRANMKDLIALNDSMNDYQTIEHNDVLFLAPEKLKVITNVIFKESGYEYTKQLKLI